MFTLVKLRNTCVVGLAIQHLIKNCFMKYASYLHQPFFLLIYDISDIYHKYMTKNTGFQKLSILSITYNNPYFKCSSKVC